MNKYYDFYGNGIFLNYYSKLTLNIFIIEYIINFLY
ncbi:hypothetical protein HNQ62_001778 [Sulfurisphaera ohwakuensis]|uniref:Uncharacterized protein n=1 Tax=Sulfurisphaera ohwakuensis TaxID=69656 RepID=A0A7J9RSL1_SULOH|nr:hypothetical protein [Sulfurisphaera ohwakuensis]